MKKSFLLVGAVALFATGAYAVTVVGNRLMLSEQELSDCQDEGGCVLATRKAFDIAVREAAAVACRRML